MSTGTGRGVTGRSKTTKRASALRFQVFNAFVDEGMASLTPHETAVWLVLFRDSKPPDGLARAAVEDIARRAGIGRRTVLRSLKQLESLRMLQVTRRGGLNQGVSSYRVFPFPAPEDWG